MKRIPLLAVVVGALVPLPSAALGNVGCSYATGPAVGPVTLQAGSGGLSKPYDPHGGAALAVGACLDTGGIPYAGGTFYGGAVEYGQNADTTEEYLVVDGDDRNTEGGGTFSSGYVGVSNYEADYDKPKNGKKPDRPPTGDCDGVDDDWPGGTPAQDGPDTNSGGCLWLIPLGMGVGAEPAGLDVPNWVVCGNASGKAWASTPRDGCKIP
jgi:hypothetical protein